MKINIFYATNLKSEVLDVVSMEEKENEYILIHDEDSENVLKEFVDKTNCLIKVIET